MSFLGFLSKPTVVVLVLLLALVGGGLLGYHEATRLTADHGVISNDLGATEEGSTQSVTQVNEADYLAEVGDIQNGSVESFARVHDKLLRYDSLTPADVEDIEADQVALKDYTDRNDNLTPPEEYQGHHELLSAATGELSEAAEIAYRVAAHPVSATPADFREYDSLVTGATANLERSNEVLGQNYRTTEGLPRVGPRAL